MTIHSDSITHETLHALIATRLDISPAEIPGDTNLITLGMNSLKIMTIVNQLRRHGIPTTHDTLATQPSLNTWWEAITTTPQTQQKEAIPN